MAEKMVQYYNYISKEMGLTGKMKLAVITKIPSIKAAMEPDSPQNIRTFRHAIRQLTGKEAPQF